jgi:hypothetical protein
VTWTDYAGDLAKPADAPVRAAEAVGNLYVTTSAGVKRIDAIGGTPEAAGVPGGLDVEPSDAGIGTAVPKQTRVAYRVAFGKKDANGRLLLGAPSGRSVFTNASATDAKDATVAFTLPRGLDSSHFFQVYRSRASVDVNTDPGDELGLVLEGAVPQTRSITQFSRATNVVTAMTSAAHGYATGQIVRVSPGGGAGDVAAVGYSAVAQTSANGTTWTTRTIPAGDYFGVAWNGSLYVAVGASVCATSPDGVTWTSRTIPAGTYEAVTWGNGLFVAVGQSKCATSPDGITWTARTIPAGNYRGVAWNGTTFAAAGYSWAATSSDGITWTSRTITGTQHRALVWTGSLFVAVGLEVSTSPDGVTWTARTIAPGVGTMYGAAWSGSVLLATGSSGPAATAMTSPDGITWTARSPTAGLFTLTAVAWNGSTFVAVSDSGGSRTTTDGTSWSTGTMIAGTFRAIATSGVYFAPGEKTITGVPLSTTFTYAETGADGTLVQAQTAEPLTGAALDTVPDGFLGAYLYTNGNTGEGIGNANARPPIAKDIAAFRDTLFALNFSSAAYGEAYLLSVGGANGLQSGDTVTINGLVYTAGASESVSARTFKLDASAAISEKITKTAASLIRVVNRSLSSGVALRDLSDPSSVPGLIGFEATDSVSSLTVTFSRATAWSPAAGISASPKTHKNGLAYSKPSEPDHFPQALTLVPVKMGSQDKAGLRLSPIRDSTLVWKEDGLWKITGNAGVWSVDPLDTTVVLIAPESAVALNGAVYALTNQGVVRANESGVEIVSRDIEPAILPLIAAGMRATTASLAFGVAYESDRKYILWLPSSPSDTECTQAWVYDVITGSWTRRTDPAVHAIVNPTDDRLYKLTAGTVRKERKTLTPADYQEATGVAIPVVVQPAPKFGGNPGALHLFNEAAWIFRSAQFSAANAGFRTNISPDWTDVPLSGSAYGADVAAVPELAVRVPVPQEKARGSQLFLRWSQNVVGTQFQLQGLSVIYRTCSTRVNR